MSISATLPGLPLALYDSRRWFASRLRSLPRPATLVAAYRDVAPGRSQMVHIFAAAQPAVFQQSLRCVTLYLSLLAAPVIAQSRYAAGDQFAMHQQVSRKPDPGL